MIRALFRGALVGLRNTFGYDVLSENLERVRETLNDVRSDLSFDRSHPRPEPDPLAIMLIFAQTLDEFAEREAYRSHLGGPSPLPVLLETTVGASTRATERGATLEYTTQLPMRNLRVIVLSDPERVQVTGIFVGNDLQSAGVPDGMHLPFGYYNKTVPPGVKVRAHVVKRKDA